MWDVLKIFGRKKDTRMENSIESAGAGSDPVAAQETSEATEPIPAPAPDPDPETVYAPSPWDDHMMTNGEEVAAGLVAQSGAPLDAGIPPASEEDIAGALRTVFDPEIPVNIYDLGLIYEIDLKVEGHVAITMTLTAPGCPVAGILPQQVADAAASVEGAGEVDVTLVWDPPWDMEQMSEDAKLALGFY